MNVKRKCQIWAFVIGKGGSTKTSLSLNLACLLALRGNKVLHIDNDEQANASLILSGGKDELGSVQQTICDLYEKPKMDIRDTIFHAINSKTGEIIPNLFYIGSDPYFEHVKSASLSKIHREQILANHIKKIRDEYDYILIDCPGDQSIATQNAIVAADKYLIPAKAGKFEMKGISIIYNLVNELFGEDYFHRICIIRSDVDKKYKKLNKIVEQEYQNNPLVKDNLLKTSIRTDADIKTAQLESLSVFSTGRYFSSRMDHINLLDELIKR